MINSEKISGSVTKLADIPGKVTAEEHIVGSVMVGGPTTPIQKKTVSITTNGTHTVIPDEGYALSKVTANVNVPIPEGYIQPSGELEVTENGTHDVTAYASVNVNVSTGGDEGWMGDGNTHIWITLHEGRTSPMLGVCPKGTVTVDWGDGTTPDVLTGTSTIAVKWTPTHNYAEPGDYIITLTVDGKIGFYGSNSGTGYGSALLRYTTSGDTRNVVYQSAVKKVEIGDGAISIGDGAFRECRNLAHILIPDSITSIGFYGFGSCNSLTSVDLPAVTSISGYAFSACYGLTSVNFPAATSIGSGAFQHCVSLISVDFPVVTSIGTYAFSNCQGLASIAIPDGVTSIGSYVFGSCSGVRYYDFTNHTAVPTLSATNAFRDLAADCEIRVPAALVDEWKAATNWVTYASQIVGG
jgi:hypothetical protein